MTQSVARAEKARLLGAFLRAHRENTSPSDVQLPPADPGARRRRTPGLRREEVAALAGVGVAWYTWLEQGRVQASRQVLEAIGRVLRLREGSFRYMMSVGGYGPDPAARREQPTPAELESVRFVIDTWQHGPAFVLDRWFDLIAWNERYAAVWGEPRGNMGNFMLALATSEHVERLLGGDSRGLLRHHLPWFRAQTAAHSAVPRVDEIYRQLERRRPELADWWTCQTMDAPAEIEFVVRLAGRPVRLSQVFLGFGPQTTLVLQRASADQPMTVDHRIDADLADAS